MQFYAFGGLGVRRSIARRHAQWDMDVALAKR